MGRKTMLCFFMMEAVIGKGTTTRCFLFFGLSSVMTAPDEGGQFPDPTQHGKQGREGRLARLMANRHKLITYTMHTVYLFRIAGAWPLPCYMRLHAAQCT